MAEQTRPQVIAIEEHFWDRELRQAIQGRRRHPRAGTGKAALRPRRASPQGNGRGRRRLSRCFRMAHRRRRNLPTTSRSTSRARVNDRPARRGQAAPDALRAALPRCRPTTPPEGADELERCVTKLGFKGAMLHGLANGVFLDDKRFWPIYERAAGTRRADLLPSRRAASGGDRGLLQGIRPERRRPF